MAVSGGVDSVVLCHLCHEAKLNFYIAHCNFGLRGEESERDEIFVNELAHQLGVAFLVKRFATKQYAEANKMSIQEAARKLRYDWFGEILEMMKAERGRLNAERGTQNAERGTRNAERGKQNAEGGRQNTGLLTASPQLPTANAVLLTAHHRDDNIETVVMNFFKGTGISGLRGIQAKQGKLIRPLLFASREEILSYAKDKGLSWVHDSSNDETKYTRNFLRHEVLPLIEKVYPDVSNNLADNISRFAETEFLYQEAIAQRKKKLLEIKGNEIHIPVLKLAKSEPLATTVYEIVKDYGFTNRQVDEVIKLLNSESGKYIVSGTHRILHNRKWLIISPLSAVEANTIVIEETDKEIFFDGKKIHLQFKEVEKFQITADPNIAILDAKEIKFPLLLRKWKQGDYFYPLGMRKKKKLSRFFIDQKLSRNEKEAAWVIESDKKVLWVVGLRIDDRFKITPQTKKILQLTISSL